MSPGLCNCKKQFYVTECSPGRNLFFHRVIALNIYCLNEYNIEIDYFIFDSKIYSVVYVLLYFTMISERL